ncbi:MAG: DUF192 domain-containing protein [Nanoarchaeota archaeon]|nr:DUF192 domain-containing protein [Nanoarchaeota archaeon]
MIFNGSQRARISSHERYCRTAFSQARGLMFRRKQNLIMEFPKEKRVSLHMLFVFFPIDVLLLNSKKEIVEIKRGFQPFSFWRSMKEGKYVVELAFPGEYVVREVLEF